MTIQPMFARRFGTVVRILPKALSALFVALILLVGMRPAAADTAHADTSTSDRTAPGDAPKLSKPGIELPPVPAGFQTRDIGWLKLSFPPSLDAWAEPLLKEAEAFRTEVNTRLGHNGLAQVHVRLAQNARQMTELAPVGAPYPDYAEGVAYSSLGLILLTHEPAQAAAEFDLLTTFRHELAHVALHDAVAPHSVPLWFNEGLAVHLSREQAFARTRALWTASVANNLLPLAEIERRFPRDIVGVPLAYAQSADVVRFLLRTQDQERFRLLIKRVGRGQVFDRALYDAYGMDLYNLESAWRQDVDGRYSLWPVVFSGTVLWTFGVVLVTLAWRRKRSHQRDVLERWAREDAAAAQRALVLAAQAAARAAAEARAQELAKLEATHPEVASDAGEKASQPPWSASAAATLVPSQRAAQRAAGQRDSQVPKVQHDDSWHTLH